MSDDLLRSFRDKIRSRSAGRGREEAGGIGGAGSTESAAAGLVVLEAGVGLFNEADRLHPLFVPGVPRVRITLEIGSDLRHRAARLSIRQLDRLLEVCPNLSRHACGAGDPLQVLLRRPDPAAAGTPIPGTAGSTLRAAGSMPATPASRMAPEDGVVLAHLIEHVAIDLTVGAAGGGRCSGVTCAWRDRLDRFDLFLESPDPALARATVLLAAALVRDLCFGSASLEAYRRGRDLLAALTVRGRRDTAPEDVCEALHWGLPDALTTLETLVRFGYLESIAAPFTFSSPTGVIFRPAPAGAPIDLRAAFPADRTA